MRTPAATRTTAILLVTLCLVMPAAHAATIQPGTIQLSGTTLHHGDTLFVTAEVNGGSGLSSLTYVFENNASQIVNVTDNLTHAWNDTYRVQRTFDGSEAFGLYVLQYVEVCDSSGCVIDSAGITTPGGSVASFKLVPPPPPGQPDLAATNLSAWGNATAGSSVTLFGAYANQGNASASGFYVSLYLDNATVARDFAGFLAPGDSGAIWASWTATAGLHTIVLVVDDGDAINESSESNNRLSRTIFVGPAPADLSVDLRSVTHEPLRTEAGDLPHPLPRHTIRLVVTNDGDETARAIVQLYATAQTRLVPIGTTSGIATLNATVPAHGSVALEYVWEPLTTLGDVTIHAQAYGLDHPDPNGSNNHDTIRDFVIVGGLGGVTL